MAKVYTGTRGGKFIRKGNRRVYIRKGKGNGRKLRMRAARNENMFSPDNHIVIVLPGVIRTVLNMNTSARAYKIPAVFFSGSRPNFGTILEKIHRVWDGFTPRMFIGIQRGLIQGTFRVSLLNRRGIMETLTLDEIILEPQTFVIGLPEETLRGNSFEIQNNVSFNLTVRGVSAERDFQNVSVPKPKESLTVFSLKANYIVPLMLLDTATYRIVRVNVNGEDARELQTIEEGDVVIVFIERNI